MTYALFLGCTIPARSRHYEMSAVEVAKALGIELIYLEDFSCCGFPIKSYNADIAGAVAARNLAIAEGQGLKIMTLCSACNSMLNEERHSLMNNQSYLEETNKRLAKVSLRVERPPKVVHFAKVLAEEESLELIKQKIQKPLKSLPVAIHYGCHYLKPSNVFENPEDPEEPSSLSRILEAIDANPIDYKGQKDCCGGAVLAFDEETATGLAKTKLINVKESGAKAMVVVCPFCSVMYDDGQKSIEKKYQIELGIPVLFLPQILGLALGLDPKALGLNLNTVKTKQLLEDILGN